MGKSLMAHIVSLYFKRQPKANDEVWRKALERRKAHTMRPPLAPKNMPYRVDETPDGQMFWLNEQSASRRTVFYFHGGGYANDFSPYHWRFLKKLIRKTDAIVAAPAFRLVPYGTCQDAFDWIVPYLDAYTKAHPDHKFILMGDSAGGGLAIALAEWLQKEGMRKADEVIVFSPWVDVTMESPEIPHYAARDPWITISFRVPGEYWAGKLDRRDPRVSPLFGDVAALSHVTALIGTADILYPDTELLFRKLPDDGTNELIVKEDLNHVYPLLPIPEARKAMWQIVQKVLR